MSSSPSSSSSNVAAMVADAGRLQDVQCRVEVLLGTGSLSVRDCLTLTPDAVIRLSQVVGSDLQVLVNGIPIAHSEVVLIDDSTAVRLTDILAPPSVSRDE